MCLIINTGLTWLNIRKRSIYDLIVKWISKINGTGLVPLHVVVLIFCTGNSRNFMHARDGGIVRSIVQQYPLSPVRSDIGDLSIIRYTPEANDLRRKLVLHVIKVL